jgi:hypothetical protein
MGDFKTGLVFTGALMILLALLFGCTESSFEGQQNYCADRCQYTHWDDTPVLGQHISISVTDTNQDCVYQCLKDLGGTK